MFEKYTKNVIFIPISILRFPALLFQFVNCKSDLCVGYAFDDSPAFDNVKNALRYMRGEDKRTDFLKVDLGYDNAAAFAANIVEDDCLLTWIEDDIVLFNPLVADWDVEGIFKRTNINHKGTQKEDAFLHFGLVKIKGKRFKEFLQKIGGGHWRMDRDAQKYNLHEHIDIEVIHITNPESGNNEDYGGHNKHWA